MPLDPAETRTESRVAFSKSLHTCQHHAEITQSYTFAALIRLPTTTHNLLTFNISKISSNNSEKLSLLANKQVRDVESRGTTSALFSHRRKKHLLARLKVYLQVYTHLIHLTPKSVFSRPTILDNADSANRNSFVSSQRPISKNKLLNGTETSFRHALISNNLTRSHLS